MKSEKEGRSIAEGVHVVEFVYYQLESNEEMRPLME